MTDEYAKTEQDALARYTKYGRVDPFPDDIRPALLNSADIADYVRLTGMLRPFDPSKDKLKPASYEIEFVGDAYFWITERGEPEHRFIGDGGQSELILEPNSIYFFPHKRNSRSRTT